MYINCRAGVLGRAAGHPHRSKLADGGGPGLLAVGAMLACSCADRFNPGAPCLLGGHRLNGRALPAPAGMLVAAELESEEGRSCCPDTGPKEALLHGGPTYQVAEDLQPRAGQRPGCASCPCTGGA